MKQIKIGTSVIDITPPLGVGILMSSVSRTYTAFKSVRLPLKGRVMVIEYEGKLFAIVALDLLGLNHTAVSGWNRFKRSIEGIVGADRIIVTCTHTHNSPETAGLTDLYKTDIFKQWLFDVESKLKQGINSAVKGLQVVTVCVGTSSLEGYSLQRRVKMDGKILLSDSLQPIADNLFKVGPIDRRVRILKFKNLAGKPVATVGHVVCHPVHEMCSQHVSPDFPGEFCLSLENSGKEGAPFFVNGGCGDINPPTVSEGPDHALRHGEALAESVSATQCEEVAAAPVSLLRKDICVGIREEARVADQDNSIIRISILRLGDIAMVFLPGEPFTKTAMEIEQSSPFPVTMVIGFSENYVGYIPTDDAFEEGGYETGPGGWSYLETDAETKIKNQVKQMLSQAYSGKPQKAEVT